MTSEFLTSALDPRQLHAARYVIARVRAEVGADLVQASLFGSRARGEARADSDVDLLLVFRSLPPDREPFASHAEEIAEQEARRLRVPVTVWSVSLVDLALGNRTPMLVDALADSLPIWCHGPPLPEVAFTPRDALQCVQALLRRTEEGSAVFAAQRNRGQRDLAARRLRDDLIRVCTGSLLLRGITRPRFGGVARVYHAQTKELPTRMRALLEWAERSYGADGKDEESPVTRPPCGLALASRLLDALRRELVREAESLQARLHQHRRGGGRQTAAEGMDLALR